MTIQEYNDIYKNPIVKSMEITSSGGVTITNTNICMEQMSLEESLCSENSLVFGACESGCFKIRIADMNHNFEGEWLTVNQLVAIDDGGCLLKEDGSYLLTEDGDRISLGAHDNAIPYGRFKVFSDKPTNDRRWRDLTCYDAMYDILNAEVIEWYNGLTFPMTMKNFRDSFFTYVGVTQATVTLVNDSFMIHGGFSNEGSLSGKTIITSICELNGVFGHISRQGQFEYISLPSADSLTLDWYMDGTGAYEDYTVQKITGITAKSSEEDVGTTVGTDTNVYIVQDNPLIYGSEGTQGLTTALTNMLNNVKDITYRPFNVSTYGNPMLPLGTNLTISTRNQTINSFLMTRVLSGIQSLKDSISADGEKYVPSQVNSLRTETKRTKGKIHELVNNVDELRSTIEDLDEEVSSEIQQLSDTIVLKVDASGNIVKVALSANPSTGSTFAVNADNITFKAGTVLKFIANNIQIDSTYFKVDQYGNLTSTSGTIGGWDINAHSLSYDYTNSGYNYSASLYCDGSDVYISTKYGLPQFTSESALYNGGIYLKSDGGNVGGQLYNLMSISYGIVGSGSSVTSTYPIITLYDSRYFGGDNTISSANITNNGLSVYKNNTMQTEVGDTIRLPYLNTYSKVLAVDGTSDQKIVATNTTITEVEYVHGVTSNIQTQLNGKQATITGGATTIVSDDLTASKALVSNANGKVAVSNVTDTELGYLSGATSNIQTQLDSKADESDLDATPVSMSGNPITITDAANIPCESLTMTIEPIQSGSGTPSTSNVRPITGLTEANAWTHGINFLKVDAEPKTSGQITYTIESDGSIKANGTADSAWKWIRICTNEQFNQLGLVPGQRYILSGNVSPTKGFLFIETTDGVHIYEDTTGNGVEFEYNGETNLQVTYIAFQGATFSNEIVCQPMIRPVSITDATFVPYINNTATISFGQTIYGGTVDFKTGIVTVTKKYIEFDGSSDEGWWISGSTTNNQYGIDVSDVKRTANDYTILDGLICDKWKTITMAQGYNNTDYGISNGGGSWNQIRLNIPKSIVDRNVNAFRTYLSNNPIQVVYPLATPQTIQLTQSQLTLIKGYNTVSANGKTISLSYQKDNAIGDVKQWTIEEISKPQAHIYGVEWDGSSSAKLTRTDSSKLFADPHPAINNGNGFSPFDNIYPWAGMVAIDDATAGTIVSIPRFWYKWTKDGTKMKLQIADAPVEGFHVSPAHMDRGDGKGERKVVYVGRYHNASDYKSKTGVTPLGNKTRAEFRTGIHNLGSTIWQVDYAMLWTIRMLYLVEFADWNSQECIGYGCGNNSSPQSVGASDNMKYHTGTSQASRTTYGVGVQYRHIEGLWDNAFDFWDGIYFSGTNVYGILNPSNFSDSANGVLLGTRPITDSYITAWNIPSVNNYDWALFPSAGNGSETTYVTDVVNNKSTGVVALTGGFHGRARYFGLFFSGGDASSSEKAAHLCSRLMVLP